jgi:microcystin-dependent protein
MSDPYLGEIRLFGGSFAPVGWAFCDGQVLDIAANDTLFALLGTTYGGDGQTTFGLPDLRGRVPVHAGQGPGLTDRQLGVPGGSETVTLSTAQLPAHTHRAHASTGPGTSTSPASSVWANSPNGPYVATPATTVPMHTGAVAAMGGNQPHDNMLPFTGVSFIIAMVGIYPSPS